MRAFGDPRSRSGGDTRRISSDDATVTHCSQSFFPYPHSDSEQWLYAEFGRYPTRGKFEESLIPRRQDLLRKLFVEHPPELIVGHGKKHWPSYKAIFPELKWRKDGPFECAVWGATRVVLAHQLAGKEFNSDEQLERFARIALPNPSSGPSVDERERAIQAPVIEVSENLAANQNPERRANRSVRNVFGLLARSYRMAMGLSPEEVSVKAAEFAGQGNPGGVRNLEAGRGWVHPRFAEGVFRAVGVPGAEELGLAYAELKTFFRDVTKEND